MTSPIINTAWLYWLITDLLLITGVTFNPDMLLIAIALTAFQVVHYGWLATKLSDFAVQVRIAYLLLLLIALYPPFYFVFYLQILGTTAMVLFNYCFLARFLSLMPWNTQHPFSLALVKSTFFSRPVKGSVQHRPAS